MYMYVNTDQYYLHTDPYYLHTTYTLSNTTYILSNTTYILSNTTTGNLLVQHDGLHYVDNGEKNEHRAQIELEEFVWDLSVECV